MDLPLKPLLLLMGISNKGVSFPNLILQILNLLLVLCNLSAKILCFRDLYDE